MQTIRIALLILLTKTLTGCDIETICGPECRERILNSFFGPSAPIEDIRLFEDTPVWDWALATKEEDTTKLNKLFQKEPDLIDYKEDSLDLTLLNWAVYNNRYLSSKTLLDLGANPNIKSKAGYSPIYYAARKDETTELLELILN